MLEAISIFDVDVMKGMSFAIVPVKTSQPAAIADELKTVFASGGDGPTAGMVKFLPNKRLGAILVISPQPRYLSRAEAWIRKLDAHAEGSEKQFYTYAVQNRGAQELVDVLESMFSTESGHGNSATTRNVSPQYQQASLQSGATQPSFSQQSGSFGSGASSASLSSGSTFGQSSSPFGQSTGSMGGARTTQGRSTTNTSTAGPDNGANLQVGGESSEEPRIKIVADEAKNSVLIEATPADYRRVMRLVGALDVLPNQVFIETTIAEVTLNDDLKFGLRWSFNNKASTYTFTDDPGGAISSVFPGFSYALAASNINVTLNALNQITNVNMISSPSLTVMDNKTAYLQIGDEVPITTQSAVSTLTAGAPVVNSVSYKDTGVILGITPRINESGRVLLDIEQEVSAVAQTTTSGIDSPTINQRRVKTSVVLNDGEALALGGLIQNSKTVTRNQIPILGDIPVVGNAFKQKDNQVAKTELIIVITPHVIRNLTEARRITDEFRRELDTYVPRASQAPRTFEQTVRRTFE